MRAALAAARERGYGVSDRQITDDAVSVAAPVRGGSGEVVAALSIVAHADASIPMLAPLVVTSARAVSRAIAGPGHPLDGHRRAAP